MTICVIGAPAESNEPNAKQIPTVVVYEQNDISIPAAATEPNVSIKEEIQLPKTHSFDVNDPMLVMNFKDASLQAVLEYLSETSGLVIIEEVKPEGRVTIMNGQPMHEAEAVALLNTVLKEKGYAAIPMGKTLKIVTLEEAKKRNIPVYSGSDPEAIPATDQLVTQVIPLQFTDAVQLKRDLAPLIPAYADLSSNAAGNALILTDTQANIRRIVEIVHSLDARMASVSEVKVFQLKYANATNAAKLINDLFQQQSTAMGGTAGQFLSRFRMFRGFGGPPGGGEGGPPGGGESATGGQSPSDQTSGTGTRQQKVTASADDRTNTVVVSGPPDTLKVIEGVIKELDGNPTEQQATFIYHLKNADATNLQTVLSNLFNTTSGAPTSSTPSRQSTSSLTGFGGTSGFGSSSFGGGFGGGFNNSNRLNSSSTANRTSASTITSVRPPSYSMTSTTVAAASDLANQVFVVADTATNSLLVTTSSKNFDRVKSIIADLDRPVPQVLIKVLIAEVTHSDETDLGMEFSALNMRASGNGQSAGFTFNAAEVAAGTNGLVIKLLETNVTAAIQALAATNKLDVLSRPYILTSDNQEATIMVGQVVPIVTSSNLTDTGQTINQIQYTNIGIILDVTPHINPDGLVIMDVYPQISALTGDTVPISSTSSAPVFAQRSAESHVCIRDGQTIVIGGLMQDQLTKNVQKVPLLGDIPVVGMLLQSSSTIKAKTELLIFMTPHVATQPESLTSMTEDEKAGMKIVPEAVEKGTFQEHMLGMQRGGTPSTVKPIEPELEDIAKP
jgi:general secretion pathway protein D